MNTFFSRTFMKEETLKEARIYHPIKLEYYKITNEEEAKQQSKAKFGINIVKIEYKKDGLQVENENIRYISNDEKEIENILGLLERNEVTPIGLEDVIRDFVY